MQEMYLYRCERCKTMVALDHDRGPIFYIDKCASCNDWADFEKIVIGYRPPKAGELHEMQVVFKLEEKKHGSSDKGQVD